MTTAEISPEVNQLLSDQIQSVEKLEVLLLLADTNQQWWSASDIASALHRQSSSIEVHLQSLNKGAILEQHDTNASLFRYSPTSGERDRAVRALARAYRERKDTVISAIFSRSHYEAASLAVP
jgi:predicted transcriptional regulator